jgi:peptidoglycan/LPS O-acetylase OafA/YrhL
MIKTIKPGTAYLPNLTPLRGIAALLTVIFHVDLYLGSGSGGLLNPEKSMLISKLYLMVDFFFVLSGFIMLHVYGKWFSSSVKSFSFKKFTIARFARVYPLHFFTLLFLVAVRIWFISAGGKDPDPFSALSFTWQSIPTNLLLIQSMNVHNWFTWNNAAWSISTEWWMYMLFPFLVAPFIRLSSAARVAVGLACFGGYVFIMLVIQKYVTVPPALSFIKAQPNINVAYQYGFLRCMFGFIIGMMIYLGYEKGFAQRFFANGTILVLSVIGLCISLHFALPDVISVAFYPLIILSAAYGSKNMDAFFGKKLMQRLGDWSFSIYLVHQPIVYTFFMVQAYFNPVKQGATTGPPPQPGYGTAWIICLIFIAIVLFFSWLSYKYIEVPSRNWINNRFKTRDAKSNLQTI